MKTRYYLFIIAGSLYIQSCSIIGVGSGIVIENRLYEEVTPSGDTLKKLTAQDYLRIELKNGQVKEGTFLKMEDLRHIQFEKMNADSASGMIFPTKLDSDWRILLEENEDLKSCYQTEIKQINLRRKTNAPILGFMIGFMIDVIVALWFRHSAKRSKPAARIMSEKNA